MHCHQGFVNHVFFDGLAKEIGIEKAMTWPEKHHLVSKGYHGRIFEGNACRCLLKNSESILELDGTLETLVKYKDAFADFNHLVANLFSSSKINISNDTVRYLLETAVASYMKLGITITLKVHVIFNHLEQMLSRCHGLGLGIYSAQAIESSHREFLDHFWYKYKIESLTNPNYAQNLMKACVEFSSKHK